MPVKVFHAAVFWAHAKAAHSSKDAVKDADLVVLAVPADKVDEVVDALTPDLDGNVIIGVTNRVNSQDPGQVLGDSSVAERIQKKAPTAKVVKAFNYVLAWTLGHSSMSLRNANQILIRGSVTRLE